MLRTLTNAYNSAGQVTEVCPETLVSKRNKTSQYVIVDKFILLEIERGFNVMMEDRERSRTKRSRSEQSGGGSTCGTWVFKGETEHRHNAGGGSTKTQPAEGVSSSTERDHDEQTDRQTYLF